jgi:hypothetical protein
MSDASDKPKRPSLDDPDTVAELLARISEGNGIWKVCEADDMPGERDVYRRMATNAAFAAEVSRARSAQQDAISDRMDKLAAEATAADWQVARLRIWTQQWNAARLAPKKYGLTTKHEHGGVEGGQPIPIRFAALSDAQLADFIQRLERHVEADQGGAADEGAED